ncbi:DUF424 domain-containing protein [Candidatus Woesearchaeota archaeon]|nr:DUF424 domain-containing protein [Candidatus Woesearchaeota archaeon]
MSRKNCSFYVGIHNNMNGRVVAICDSGLLGQTLECENYKIEVSKTFYGGELMSEDKVVLLLKKERNLNLIGKNIIELCLELGIIAQEHILMVNDTPHMQLIEL